MKATEETVTFNGEAFPVTVSEDGSKTIFYGGRFGYEKWQVNHDLDLPLETQLNTLREHWCAAMSILEPEESAFNGFVGGGLRSYNIFPCDGVEYLIEIDADGQWAMVIGYR